MTKADTRPLITFSIPVYNEEANIRPLLARCRAVADQCAGEYTFEFLFTDNSSRDRTLAMLEAEVASDPRVRVLKLSRNFGFQRSILANFLNARGAAAIQIDADLQDPPELATEFLRHWKNGFKVVYGIRQQRTESIVLLTMRKMFYRLVDRLTDFPVPVDAGDFRLVDRLIIEQLRTVTDRNPYLRGLIASFGYAQVGVPYSRSVRTAGASKFGFVKLLTLGIDGITSQSTKPLQYITLAGFVMCVVSIVLGLSYAAAWFMGYSRSSPGFTTLVILQLLAISLNAVLLGVIGEYVGRIFDNVRGHPMVLVEREIENPASRQPQSVRAAEADRGDVQ
jgi:polyisoprenyl-phosphate glycosyltransferase